MSQLRRLFGPGQLTNAAVTKYTVPANIKTLMRHIHVANGSAGAVPLTVSIGADAAGTRIIDAESIPANSTKDYWGFWVLAAGEIVQAFAGTTLTLNLEAGGEEDAA
jgi:hypothetical protein